MINKCQTPLRPSKSLPVNLRYGKRWRSRGKQRAWRKLSRLSKRRSRTKNKARWSRTMRGQHLRRGRRVEAKKKPKTSAAAKNRYKSKAYDQITALVALLTFPSSLCYHACVRKIKILGCASVARFYPHFHKWSPGRSADATPPWRHDRGRQKRSAGHQPAERRVKKPAATALWD